MVIDFHVHCFPDELADKAVPVLAERAKVAPLLDGTVKSLKESMKRAGVDKSIVLSIATRPQQTEKINTWSAEIQENEILTFGSVHPEFDGWEAELLRIKKLGLRGIKFHPDYQSFYVEEKRMYPIYEKAFELGLTVLFHAGTDIGLPAPYHCTPEGLRTVIDAFPGGRIVAAHMGGYDCWDDVERLLLGRDIYLDTSYSLAWIKPERARDMILGHGFEKVLFATDSPWTDQAEEIGRLKKLELGEEAELAVLGGNAARLLELSEF